MKIHQRDLLEEVRSSYWFIPAIMTFGAFLLSIITIAIDRRLPDQLHASLSAFWGGDIDGIRLLLSTIASSTITVAGVSFSILIVALSQMSAQFGPRLLRRFMRDRSNQLVLGIMTSTFLYCLLILRAVQDNPNQRVAPPISVTLGVVLAGLSLGAVIYFLHHAAQSIQAPTVIASIGRDLAEHAERLFPERLGHNTVASLAEAELKKQRNQTGCTVGATRSGYIQGIDEERLMELVVDHNYFCILHVRPGMFVELEGALITIYPGERVTETVADHLLDAFIIDDFRNDLQDIEFTIEYLVQIAVRSLSAATNDPLTTIACIDWLAEGMSRIVQREFPSPYRSDRSGKLRLYIEHPLRFTGVLEDAFNQIRQYAGESVAVNIHLLEALERIALHTRNEERRQAIRRQAEMVRRNARAHISEPNDLQDLEVRYHRLMQL